MWAEYLGNCLFVIGRGGHTVRRLLELQAGGRGNGPPRGSGDEGLTGSESGSGGDAGEHFESALWLLLLLFVVCVQVVCV